MSLKQKLPRKVKAGQTVIEFALVSVIFIFMLVVTFNAILAFSMQQYLSYAAFMAARAYQASGTSPDQQRQAARKVLSRYIPDLPSTDNFSGLGHPIKFKNFAKPLGFVVGIAIPEAQEGDYGQAGPSSSKYIGISFRVPFAELPLGQEVRDRFGLITLETRSFLGREVSQNECRGFFRGFFGKFKPSGANPANSLSDEESAFFMEDNGC